MAEFEFWTPFAFLELSSHFFQLVLYHASKPWQFLIKQYLVKLLQYANGFLAFLGIVADSNAYDQSKRLRTGGDYSHAGYTAPSPFHPPPAPVWGPHG